MSLLYPLDVFCGNAPDDPNAATAVVGEAPVAVVTYTCLTGFLDSDGDDSYKRTCTAGSWVLADGTVCSGESHTRL